MTTRLEVLDEVLDRLYDMREDIDAEKEPEVAAYVQQLIDRAQVEHDGERGAAGLAPEPRG